LGLHGVKKPVTLDVTVREISLELVQKAKWGDQPGMAFAGSFKIKLSDHGIKISEAAQGKINDEWTITFDLTGLLSE
jgi:polyisoprenoid-binding protein YceI